MAARVKSAVGEREMQLGAHTGSTEESGAVDGEEDRDPVLDCE